MSVSPPERAKAGPDARLTIDEAVRLHLEGAPVRLSQGQQAYLLLLAAAGDEGMRRDVVIRVLWDEDESRVTRHRLRQLSYSVNRKFGFTAVRADGPRVGLESRVVLSWQAEPAGTAIRPPSARFADHLTEIHDERRRVAGLDAVRRLDAARLSDHPEAVLRSLRSGDRTPGSWRDVLWALLRMGRVREAEFELRQIIGDDLPMESLPTARRVAARGDRLLSLAAAGGEASIPLRAREEEVRQLHASLVSGASCILITGARGVGRSRILGQAVATLLSNQDDTETLAARGVPFERHTPFGGLEQLLSQAILVQAFAELGQPETEVIKRALPVQFASDESHTLAELGGPGSYLRIARALATLFDVAYGQADILLLVDDLELMDRSTVEVVTRLVLISNARLLATWCTDDDEALSELLFRFRGVAPDLVPLLDLPLGEAAWIAKAVSPDLTAADASDVARLSGGRPGRVVELLRALGGSPILNSPATAPNLDELLRLRVRELSSAAQEALVILSVGGGRLPIPTIADLLDCGLLEASGHVRSLEEAGLVELEGERAVVTSGLLRDFVERELPGPVRRDTHTAIAEHMLRDPENFDPGSLGRHLLGSGRPVEAAAWFKKAGLEALDRTAPAEALVLLEQSVAANDELDPEIARILGSIQSGMGDFKQAIHWYGRARIGYVERGDQVGDIESVLREVRVRMKAGDPEGDLAKTLVDQFSRAEATGEASLISPVLEAWFTLADHFHSWSELDRAKGLLLSHLAQGEVPAEIAFVGSRLTYLGSPQLGLRLASKAYLHGRDGRSGNLASLHRLLLCLWARGKFHRRRAGVLVTHADELATGTGNLESRLALWSALSLWHLDSRQWEEAESCLTRANSEIVLPARVQRVAMAVNHAILAVRTGQPGRATEYLAEVGGVVTSYGRTMEMLSTAVQVLAALERGRLSQARSLARRLDECDLRFPFASNLALVPEAQAELLRREGRLERALTHLQQSYAVMRKTNVPCAQQLARRIEFLSGLR